HRHDVASFDRCGAPVVVEAAVPDRETGVAEAWMEAVDGLDVQGLVLTRRPVPLVDRDTAEDPGARVAHEERVRKRRDDEVGRAHRVLEDGRDLLRHLTSSYAADQAGGKLVA